MGFAVDDQCSVRIFFGLFAIRRAGTTNYAMFDPDFCGVWSFICCCAFHSAFFTDYDFSSPQNRFKGPKVVRLQSLRNSRKQKRETHHKGVFPFFGCGGGICKEQSDGIAKPQASVSHDLRVIASRPSIHIVATRARSTCFVAPCSVDFVHPKQHSVVLDSSPNEHRSSFYNPRS